MRKQLSGGRGGIRRAGFVPLAASALILTGAMISQGVVGSSAADATPSASITPAAAPNVAGPRPPALPVGAFALFGPSVATTPLNLTVAVAPRDPAALAAFAAAVSTPGSPEYHHFVTPAQFASSFGPTSATLRQVLAKVASLGLAPGAVSPGGLSFQVHTTFAQAAAALNTSFQDVRLASGRIAYRHISTPSYPAGVQAIVGLDDLVAMHPLGLRPATALASGPTACPSAVSAATNYSAYLPNQLASAYSMTSLYGSGNLGAGVNVALYELAPFNAADIAAYQSCYGTSASVSVQSVDGGTSCTSCGGIEAALDIEDVIGLAPKAAITVYEAPNATTSTTANDPYDNYAAIINADTSQVISTSWGVCEALLAGTGLPAAQNTLFQQAAAQGQSILAAAGDSGSADCNSQNSSTALSVDDPASQPYVTGVGGTSLSAIGPPPTETVWNNGSSGGGGGGISSLWPMPAWQSGPGVLNSYSSGVACAASSGNCREVPDVTASANPNHGYVIYYSGTATGAVGWQGIGGASAAAPLWAAIVALTDASCPGAGYRVGFLNPTLYKAGAASVRPFNDITTGNNDTLGTNGGLYPATTGYDMASGLGSPIASALAPILCSAAPSSIVPAVLASTATAASVSPITTVAGASATYSASVSSASGTPSGSVAFTVGSATLCSATLSSATGSCSASNAPTGTDTVSATYSGDSSHSSSVGTTALTVTGSATTTTTPTTTTLPTTTTTTTTTTTPVAATFQRLAGANRDATAVAVSQAAFPTAGSASAVVLARNDVFADALAGGPLAAADHGPLLLTSPGSLDPATQGELGRVLPSGGTVYVLGGTGAISSGVTSTLRDLGYKVTRVAGASRFATAVAIAQVIGSPTTVFEATGLNFPDALSAVPAAVVAHGAILLTNGTTQASQTAAYLQANPGLTRHAVGGPAAAADPGATALTGADRFATSALVAQKFFPTPKVVALASGLNFPDALAGGPYAGSLGGPVLLVPPTGALPSGVQAYLSAQRASIGGSFLFGGTAAVGDNLLAEAQLLLG
jgi:putative cell wall-binding protein